ncbi:uncharacterized protein LOC112195170 isoform X6 [Rosa chinensis]|uniref:uncharacterized protein LOC112195170 isoform X6 n=1 Tax=Rosa chinensis TaxID=74649 RepID=UPI000D0897F0|nr:uncharacterized protein LOC112195170 isoform X6 [Rosa chinensis]
METGAQYRFWRGCGFLRFWSVGGEGAAGLISVETGKDLVDFCILGCFGEKRNSWASPVDIEKRGFDWLMVVEYSHDEIGFQVGNEEMCAGFKHVVGKRTGEAHGPAWRISL